MVAQDFLLDSQVRAWLDGVEPAWSLLTFESFQELRQEPSATRTAIRIGNDLSLDEIAGSPIARNTLILIQEAIEHGGLPLTATGNLTRAVVAEMCKLLHGSCRCMSFANLLRQRLLSVHSAVSWS